MIGRRRDGRIGELHGAVDHGLEHLVAERVDDPLEHLARVQGARVVHGREDAVELDRRVEPVAHLVDGLDEQRHAAQREELALERDQHAVARGERVDGEQAERRLAVDEDDVVVGRDPAQHAREDLLAGDLGDEVHLGRREVDVRRDHVEVRRRPSCWIASRGSSWRDEQQVVDRRHVVRRHAEAGRQRALRVEVDREHPPAVLGERGTEVDRRRGLADAALLVAQGDDACGPVRLQCGRLGEVTKRPTCRAQLRLERRDSIAPDRAGAASRVVFSRCSGELLGRF